MQFRRETKEDANAVYDLLIEVFPTADEAKLVRNLNSHNNIHYSLCAIDTASNNRLVGYIAYSPITLRTCSSNQVITESKCLGLAPLAVHPNYQKQGLGSLLCQMSIKDLSSDQHVLFVLGDTKYYGKFGFKSLCKDQFECKYPLEHMMKIGSVTELNQDKIQIAYSPEFDEL